jgi:hypothetical protein
MAEILDAVKAALKQTNDSIEASNKQNAQQLRQALNAQENVIKRLSAKIDNLESDIGGGGGGITRGSSYHAPMSGDPSMSRSRSRMAQADVEEDALDPVTIGDQMLLNASEMVEGGFLHGDLASHRVGLQEFDAETKRDALNFNDYVFRVCPMLNYRQRNELDVAQAKETSQSENPKTLNRKQSAAEMDAQKNALDLLKNRVLQEEAHNLAVMDRVIGGEHTGSVKYGDIFQLQHVKSGAFLTVLESAAPFDPECRGLTLSSKGSSAALFKFTPRFKAQTEGSIVYYSHSVRIESVKQRGYLVHISSACPYSPIPDWRNSLLPKSLQTGKIYEANLATEPTAKTVYKVSKYARFGPQFSNVLQTSAPFRLYHSQSESFVQASSDAEKDRRNADIRDGGDPCHVPFLKKLPDLGENPDPTDPLHQVPKSVWAFEPLRRTISEVVEWDGKIRVRHVPSGRYLAVDTSAPVKEDIGGQQERWFRTFLVDDASREEDLTENDAGLGFKTVALESMIFTVSAADVTSSNYVPDSNVSLRLEHACTFSDGTAGTLYLHNSEDRKPQLLNKVGAGAVIARSFRLVFSTVRSAQDIFKLMSLAPQECYFINLAAALRRPCDLYAFSVKDPSVKIKPEFMTETVRVLLKLFAMQIKGSHEFSESTDWIKKANSMLPAGFSALFTGEPDVFVQRICRDMKLMDALFVMGTAAYSRAGPDANPWGPEGINGATAEEMLGPKGIQKLVHVGLQLACSGNSESQAYFGRRKSGGILWMTTILEQLEDPLGSAVTLSKLLSSNAEMMRRYAVPNLVKRFLDMIGQLGPQPRLVSFFEAICTVDGVAVKSNQEMILRLTWMNEDARSKAYLFTQSFDIAKNPTQPALPKLPPVPLPSGEKTDGKLAKGAAKKHPPNFIGKELYESDSSFHPVFVRWLGDDNWGPNMDALFHSPKSLNMKTFDFGRDGRPEQVWCRIEDLCWVLEPARLCEAVTGQAWGPLKKEIDVEGSAAAGRMKNQVQLAEYYVGQLNLLGKQCGGRSYNCISWMEKSFSYEMLCSMCYNVHLPPKVRSASSQLVKNLYLDRYPQLANCGKASLPEELWVYETGPEGKNCDLANVPLIKPLALKDAGSLAEFAITPSHKFHNDPEPFYGFPTGFKFFLLRNLCNQYLAGYGDGTICHSELQENSLANTISALISALMSFGFQSSHAKIKDLLKFLVRLLDGRTDVESKNSPFEPLSDRFKQSPQSPQVTGLKSTIIDILIAVSNLRANFRLAKLMQKFKEYNTDERTQTEMKKIHAHVVENKMDRYESDFSKTLFDDFEELFVKGDGAELDLGVLSGGQNMDVILVDALMYQDDKLFARALSLLNRTYGQRRKLIDALGDVTLLQQETVPIFGNVAEMNSELGFLIFLVRSSEVWGVSSRVSGPFGPDKYNTVVMTCDKINSFLLHAPMQYEQTKTNSFLPSGLINRVAAKTITGAGGGASAENPIFKSTDKSEQGDNPYLFHQNVLRSMNAQTTLVEALNIDYNLSFKGSICSSEDKIESRRMLVHVQSKLVETLCLFVKGNAKNQRIIFKHLGRLRKHLGPLKLPETWPADFSDAHKASLPTAPGMNTEEVIIECLRNNWDLCDGAVPRDLLEDFGSLLENEPDPSESDKLDLFRIMCQPIAYGRTIPRNQEMVVDVLLSDNLPNVQRMLEQVFWSDNSKRISVMKPENVLRVLTATILDGNLACAAKLQGKRFTIDCTVKAIEGLLRQLLEGNNYTRERAEDAVLESEHFCALIEFLANQLDVLVLDPKLFRMDETWHILCVGVNHVLAAIVRNPTVMSEKLAQVVACACRVGHVIVDGARSLGLQERQWVYRNEISDADNSVFRSAQALASSVYVKQFPKALIASNDLATLVSPLKQRGSLDGKEVRRPSIADEIELDTGLELSDNFDHALAKKTVARTETIVEAPVGDDSQLGIYVDPATMTEYFHEALDNNVFINKKLLARKFHLLHVLETAAETTGEGGVKNGIKGAKGEGAVTITWDQIVVRMVSYMREHNYDPDETTCLLILRCFRFHLLKARSTDSGTEIELCDMSDKAAAEYSRKQSSYVDFKVVDVVLTAIATHPANVEGNLADESIELLIEMMNGGNEAVQSAILHYIEHEDRDNKLLMHIRARMAHSLVAIKERKDRTINGFQNMTEENRVEFENCAQTFLLLQEMCEGHYFPNQEILRIQPTHSASINLVETASKLFMSQCETSSMLLEMEEAEVELIITSLELLTEMVQGPCKENQNLIVATDGMPACLDKVIQSTFHSRIGVALKLKVKAAALQLLASCLEGRDDLNTHNLLAEELDPDGFELFRVYCSHMVDKSKISLENGRMDEEEFAEIESITLEAFSCVKCVILELRMVPSFLEKSKLIEKGKKRAQGDLLDEIITTIEVAWKDRIETVSFPIPKDADFLTVKTREDFLIETDLSTAEKRMKDLLSRAPVFMAEMQQIYNLSQWSQVYLFIHHNIVNIKWSMYALVVLLNLNIIMASYGEGSPDGYPSISDGLKGLDDDKYETSLYISLVLAVLNLMGYIVIVTFLAVTEVPIIIRQLDDYVDECLDNISMKEADYRDPGAFTWWFVTLIFNVLFIIMHLSNYPGKENQGLYLFLVLGINLPWTLSCVRNYIVVPNTPQTRIFCVIYDVLITKPFFRNHVILMICSINGFQQSSYFPLMLMDIMNNSAVLADIARSVTDNIAALGLVFYLFICTVAIYAQFGLEYFEDWFVYDGDADDEEAVGCHSVVSCFVLIFYNGVPNGSLSDVLDNISNRNKDTEGQDPNTYLQRVLFDLSFFIWVGILLFNIITGLMVDGFGALREEANNRDDILENTCFVCGFTRSQYDDVPNFRGPSFDAHSKVDHFYWTYVYFYVYLKRKDKTTLSGVESYVWKQILDNNLAWIPTRASAAIQNSNAEVAFDNEKEIDIKMIEQMAEDMVNIKHVVAAVEKKLNKKD